MAEVGGVSAIWPFRDDVSVSLQAVGLPFGGSGGLMGELLDRAFTEQRLLEAWSAVREAALADGEAGPEVERFEAAAARRISELSVSLAHGTFQPSAVMRVEIAKPSGGVRPLAVPPAR